MLSLTHQALEKFDNQHDFERMCADVLNSLGYTDVVLIAPRGGSDGGRDITYTTSDGQKGLACVTLRKDSDAKFKEDLHKRASGEHQEYIYFTNQYLSAKQKLDYTRYCIDELEASFKPIDIEALRSLLDSALRATRKQFLHIEDETSPKYKLRVIDARRYSARKLVETAIEAYEEKEAEFKTRSAVADRIPVAFPGLGIPSTDSVLKGLNRRVAELAEVYKSAEKVLSFNIALIADSRDEHIEVTVHPPEGSRLTFDDSPLEVPVDRSRLANIYGLTTPIIPSVPNIHPRTETEFLAIDSEDGSIVRSSLARLNAKHEKKVFDEVAYLYDVSLGEPIKLKVTIHSGKLDKPIITSLMINPSGLPIIEIVDSYDYDD